MQEIKDVILDRAARLTAGDVAGMLAHHAPEVVEYSLAPPLGGPIDGRDPKPLSEWVATFEAPPRMAVTRLAVTAGDDVAFATSIDSMTATPRGTAEEFTLWFRVTLGLRRIDGRWLVTHEHHSVPFYMDEAMRAAVDLRP
jgi:ketosteroid isomerase-like protein